MQRPYKSYGDDSSTPRHDAWCSEEVCVYVSPSLLYLTSLILHLARALKFALSQVINQQSMLFWSVVQLVEWFGEVLHSQGWIDSDGFTAHSLNQLLHNEEVQENKMWTFTALI